MNASILIQEERPVSPVPVSTKGLVYALVGNPNAGKTTLFNQLTGLRQKVANYPGVTVEKKVGTCYSQHGQKMTVIDLPGSYSLSAQSPDEAILQKVLMGRMEGVEVPDRILCIVDSTNLERNLYLAAQVSELGLPTILVLNMKDLAQKRGLFIDTGRLEKELGVTVVATQANKKEDVVGLRLAMSRSSLSQPKGSLDLPEYIAEAVLSIQAHLIGKAGLNLSLARGKALMLLMEGTDPRTDDAEVIGLVSKWQMRLSECCSNWKGEVVQCRYERVNGLFSEAVHQKGEAKWSFTDWLDSILLHRVYGWVILFSVMALLFSGVFSFAQYPMDLIESGFGRLGSWAHDFLPEGPLRGLIVDGVIRGVGSVLAFLPQIFLLLFFIGVMEASGYLPRAAFLLDRVMKRVGLPGRSFIPLLSSFACAVPAVMATRTLASKHERLVTILITPWISCSARLPVYLLMIAALVPAEMASPVTKAGILIMAYSLGAIGAFVVAWILRKTFLKGPGATSLMELPPYRMPTWRNIFIEVYRRGMSFIKRAGTVILAFSIIIWFLMAYPRNELGEVSNIEESYIGSASRVLEPVIEPLGYDWKVGVGLAASFAARELFVSTMAILYNVEVSDGDTDFSLGSVLANQKRSNGTPVFTPLTCLSLMVFFIFAMQCVSTLVIVRRETGSWKWPLFQWLYMTGFAYLAALIVFQGGRLLGFV